MAEGAHAAIADVDVEAARTLADRTNGAAFPVHLDVTQSGSIQAMVAAVVERAGSIDILVNNAAVFDLAPILEVTEKSFDFVFAVNVKGLFFTLQAVAATWWNGGSAARSSTWPRRQDGAGGAGVVYCASKAAVISLTQSAGLDLIKHRINVNGIAPGVVDTPMWAEVDALFARYENRPIGEKSVCVGEAVPYGRMGRPEDHAGAAVFLASDDADYVVAQTLNVDGGNWMS